MLKPNNNVGRKYCKETPYLPIYAMESKNAYFKLHEMREKPLIDLIFTFQCAYGIWNKNSKLFVVMQNKLLNFEMFVWA